MRAWRASGCMHGNIFGNILGNMPVPQSFMCPIFLKTMQNPAVDLEGKMYVHMEED